MAGIMDDYDIFRHHLFIAAPSYGRALWNPNSGNLSVNLGDVGYISKGNFRRLFNVSLPADHQSHLEFGVPEYHEPLTLNKDQIRIRTLSPDNLCSTYVTLGPKSNRYEPGRKAEGELSFSCPINQGGAALCLPIVLRRKDIIAKSALEEFGKRIVNHIDRWFKWARNLKLEEGPSRMDDIILVTGTHRTRSYVNAAFPGGQEDAEVSFTVRVDLPGNIIKFPHKRNRGAAMVNYGPKGEDLLEDQCIFVRGFYVTRKYKIFRKLGPNPVTAGDHEDTAGDRNDTARDRNDTAGDCDDTAGDNEDTAGDNEDTAGDHKDTAGDNEDPVGEKELDKEHKSVQAVPKYWDPIHILLRFIDKYAPNCDMVLVHDNDLADLHGVYDSTPIEHLQPDVMLSHLRSAELKIHEVSFGTDLSSVDNDGSADTDTIRIATLSDLFAELPAPSTSSSSQSRHHVKTLLPRLKPALLDETALHLAAQENDSEMAELLLEQGANANAKNFQGLTPLYYAAYGGRLEAMRVLLLHGAEVGTQYRNGETALHIAARNNHSEMAKLLLEHGADVNAKNIQELTPLYCAAYEGQMSVARVLLRCSADVEALDENGETSLHLAARRNHSEMATLLLDHNADVNAKNVQELTPLYCATYKRSAEVIRTLLPFGADVEARDKNGVTALHIAAWKDYFEIATMLLQHGADVNARNIQELTPLYYAAQEENLQVMRVLLQRGANVEARDKNQQTALHLAARKNHLEMAELLLEHGAGANSKDIQGLTPLYCATYVGHLEVMRVLLRHGVDVRARSRNGQTALHLATQKNHVGMAKLLLEHGFKADDRDIHNLTPLHYAAQEGQPEMRALLLHGADTDSRNK